MSLLIAELYDALKNAGADEDHARAAAEAVAHFENRLVPIERDLGILKWMVGTLIVLQIMSLGASLAVLYRLTGH